MRVEGQLKTDFWKENEEARDLQLGGNGIMMNETSVDDDDDKSCRKLGTVKRSWAVAEESWLDQY